MIILNGYLFYKKSERTLTKDLLVEIKMKKAKNTTSKNECSCNESESPINIKLLNRRRATIILSWNDARTSQYLPSFQKIEELSN